MNYHKSGGFLGIAAITVPVLHQAVRDEFLSPYAVGESGEATTEKWIRYLYPHPLYLGDELGTLMRCRTTLGRCVYRR
jgi:hypothetical protein